MTRGRTPPCTWRAGQDLALAVAVASLDVPRACRRASTPNWCNRLSAGTRQGKLIVSAPTPNRRRADYIAELSPPPPRCRCREAIVEDVGADRGSQSGLTTQRQQAMALERISWRSRPPLPTRSRSRRRGSAEHSDRPGPDACRTDSRWRSRRPGRLSSTKSPRSVLVVSTAWPRREVADDRPRGIPRKTTLDQGFAQKKGVYLRSPLPSAGWSNSRAMVPSGRVADRLDRVVDLLVDVGEEFSRFAGSWARPSASTRGCTLRCGDCRSRPSRRDRSLAADRSREARGKVLLGLSRRMLLRRGRRSRRRGEEAKEPRKH